MSTIEVQCIDQTLTVVNAPVIASGDIQTDSIHFEFCNQWSGFAKFGVFYKDKGHVYKVAINESTKLCIIPKEVLQEEGIVYFGVFGVKGSGSSLEQKTSEVLKYRIKQGILTEGATPSTPTPDIYEQILVNYAELIAQAHVFTEFTDEEMDEILNGTYTPSGDDDPSTRESIYAEVVEARNGESSLDIRLDNDNQKVTELNDKISLFDFSKNSKGKTFIDLKFIKKSNVVPTLDLDSESSLRNLIQSTGTFENEAIALTLEPDVPTADSHKFGIRGQICIDSNYIYICVSDDEWKKIALLDL